MIKDHTGTSAELKAIAAKAKMEVPTALDSSHQSKLDKLKSLNGADFDKQYDADQLAVHKDAVSLFERYAKGGDNKAVEGVRREASAASESASAHGGRIAEADEWRKIEISER